MATHSSILVWRTPWSLAGYSPWGCKESDVTEHACTHACIQPLFLTHWPCQTQGERTSGSSLRPMRCFSTSKHYFRKNYLFYIGIELICNIVLVSGIQQTGSVIHMCCLCLVVQSCPTLCDPVDYSLPGSSVHGILQARVLEWVAIPFSRGSS